MTDRHVIDVHLLLCRDDRLLLTRRRDTDSRFDGRWHLPSGKLDSGESVLDAMAREAKEEIGIVVEPADLRHVHTLHVNGSGPEARLGLFFEARRWAGEPVNLEPEKCSAIDWFPLNDLPERIIDYPAAGIRAYRTGVALSVCGWARHTVTAAAASRRNARV
jgi:8-oxo-dGTP diphosphatase